MTRSDIVLLTVDSLRYDSVYSEDRTVLDRLDVFKQLAESGTNFHDAWATAPFTVGSFPAILGGSYQWSFPSHSKGIPSTSPYLVEELQNQGYSTIGFHSNPHLDEQFGWDRGFDHYFSGRFENSESNLLDRIQNTVRDSDMATNLASKMLDATGALFGVDIRGKPYLSASTLQSEAKEWIDENGARSPLFLWIHYMDVHNPWYPEEGTASADLKKEELIKAYYTARSDSGELSDAETEILKTGYKGSVQQLNDTLGPFVDYLRENLSDPTIWLTSDHGELFGEDGEYLHPPSVNEDLLRIPMIIASPDGNLSEQSPVSTIDIAPTMLDSVGAPVPDEMDGVSLLRDHEERTVYAESGHAEGGQIRVISEENTVYSIEETSSMPASVAKHANKILAAQSDSPESVYDSDLNEQLRALGYK